MRPPSFAYARAEMQAQVLARLEAGYTHTALAALHGYPSRATIHRWAREEPAFARRLAEARAWGRSLRRQAALSGRTYDEARAQALLLRVRRGERVVALTRTPGQPNREALDAWKRQRPDFAQALAEAVRFSRQERSRPWPYDEAVADRLILRVIKGERLREVMKDPSMPGRTAIRRWRRLEPAFAGALKAAVRTGYRRRATPRPSLCTPQLAEAIAAHVLAGGSLFSASRAPGMPHYMTLYHWRRRRPDFTRAIVAAEWARDDRLMDCALGVALASTPTTADADRATVAAMRLRLGQLGGGRRG
jgi:hypothetical protein